MIDAAPLLALLPSSFLLAQAEEIGLSRRVISRLVRSGAIRRMRPGVYRQAEAAAPVGWSELLDHHLIRCQEELHGRPGHAVSHLSAGVVLGLPARLHAATPVHLTTIDRAPKSRLPSGLVVHHCDSMTNETMVQRGLRITTPARTLADVARTHPFSSSVAMIDAALRTDLVTRDDIARVLDAQIRWRGRPQGYAALSMTDGRRETWLESYSFTVLHLAGLPMPEPQVEIFDAERAFVGRVDGLLLDHGVVLEADGLGKYTMERRVDHSVESAVSARLVEQNARQLAIEKVGLRVVRWTTPEITQGPDMVIERVRSAVRNSNIGRFSGWLRLNGAWWRPS